MIYYSNVAIDVPHMAFIGRWSPFHKGHAAIIEKKRFQHPNTPILILVRNTSTDVYSPVNRAQYLKLWMIENNIQGTIMIIPNIEGVYYGREVGYTVEQVNVDEKTQKISGSGIRDDIQKQKTRWQSLIAHKNDSYLLSKNISTINERGLVVWLTGCPSSGKTTIAKQLIRTISSRYPYLKTQLLDGDQMRTSPLARHIGFTPKDRAEHILRMAYLAKMFAGHGILTICAFVSPNQKIREQAKTIIGRDRFIEVYVKASKKNRILRDVKGLYKQAKEGKITNLSGYNSVYQPPPKPNVICNTNTDKVETCAANIIHNIFS